jgi:hypothetical protein
MTQFQILSDKMRSHVPRKNETKSDKIIIPVMRNTEL